MDCVNSFTYSQFTITSFILLHYVMLKYLDIENCLDLDLKEHQKDSGKSGCILAFDDQVENTILAIQIVVILL